MAKNSSTSRSKKRTASIRALWLLPLGILLVEAGLRLMPEGFMERTVNLRMGEIETLPAPEIQIMGDSVTAGLNAADLEKAAGLPEGSVQNYSLPGTSPMFAYFTLQRELAAGRAPKVILFAPHPANLETPMIDRFMGRFCTGREGLDLLSHGVSLPEWLFGAACRASVAMRDREEMRAAVTQGNFGFFQTLRTPAVSVLISRTPIAGPAAPPAALNLTEGDYPAQFGTPFFVDRVNGGYIDRFCDLAESRGIRVAWVTVPVIGFFKERGMSGGGEGKFQAYLEGLAARHRNVTLLDRELTVYPDDCFADAWHLNRYGEWRWSLNVGAAVKRLPE